MTSNWVVMDVVDVVEESHVRARETRSQMRVPGKPCKVHSLSHL